MKNVLYFVDLKEKINQLHKPIYLSYLKTWLEENCKSWYSFESDFCGAGLGNGTIILSIAVGFSDEAEATHFKLVWG